MVDAGFSTVEEEKINHGNVKVSAGEGVTGVFGVTVMMGAVMRGSTALSDGIERGAVVVGDTSHGDGETGIVCVDGGMI